MKRYKKALTLSIIALLYLSLPIEKVFAEITPSSSGSGSQSTASSSTQTQASTTIDTTSSTSPSVSEPSNTTNSKILQESDTAQTQTSSTTEQSTSKKMGLWTKMVKGIIILMEFFKKGNKTLMVVGIFLTVQQEWWCMDNKKILMANGISLIALLESWEKDRSMMLEIGISLIDQVG